MTKLEKHELKLAIRGQLKDLNQKIDSMSPKALTELAETLKLVSLKAMQTTLTELEAELS